jgi:cysteinyl-tRNA synthetase
LTGVEEEFWPQKEGEVRLYVCGITVYDSSHIGHARSLVTFDTIYRYLKFLGYQVTFVRNFTDIDDKIINRAREEGASAEKVAARYIAEFQRDTAAMGLLPPTHEPKATEHIPEMIALISRLVAKRAAYQVGGDVYFSVESFPAYGKLSRRRLDELAAGARVEVDERKRSPLDFVLWKASKEGEPFWESPWGRGRPGWHIECSAMSTKYLGQPFDIHGGGMDLIFPHHENEIAQSEAATGQPLARCWIHNGFLNINQEKMSKSLGNIYSIQEINERSHPAALRYYFLGSHYRSPLDFSFQGLAEAERAVERVYDTLDRAERLGGLNAAAAPDAELVVRFKDAMDDDFNTPRAMALLFDVVRGLNRAMDEGRSENLAPRARAVARMGEVLGVLLDTPERFLAAKRRRWMRAQGLLEVEVEELIRLRDKARREKKWHEADRIRDELNDKGIVLEDGPGGTVWKVR